MRNCFFSADLISTVSFPALMSSFSNTKVVDDFYDHKGSSGKNYLVQIESF